MKKDKKYYGPLMMVLASICFATGGAVIKLIPWSPFAINGMRNLFAAAVIFTFMRVTHHKFRINRTVLVGAICMFCVTTLFIMANKMTTAANAIILQYTCPIWIIIILAVFCHKMPSRKDILAVLIVLVGIMCFFYDSIGSGNMQGNVVAVFSGIAYAGVYVINEFKDGDSLSSFFLGQLLCGIILGPTVAFETVFTPVVLIAVIYMGAVQVGMAYVFFSEGTKYTPPVTACLINAVEPILNPILVAIFWGEMMDPLSLIGGGIVILTVVIYNLIKV